MGEHNLARRAEGQLERLGDFDSLFFEGTWWSTGTLADRASRMRLAIRLALALGTTPIGAPIKRMWGTDPVEMSSVGPGGGDVLAIDRGRCYGDATR